jgi:ribonuclease P protein component
MAGLPPGARIRRPADFAALRQGHRVASPYFYLRWAASAHGGCRLGMAVSRRVSKRAVVRNQIKRVIRESFRARRGELPPLDVLVSARASAAQADKRSLRADLDRLWRKLQSLKRPPLPGTMGG